MPKGVKDMYMLISVQARNDEVHYKYYDVVNKRLVIRRNPLRRLFHTAEKIDANSAAMRLRHPISMEETNVHANVWPIGRDVRAVGRSWGLDAKPQIVDSWERGLTMGRWYDKNFKKTKSEESVDPISFTRTGIIDQTGFEDSMERWRSLLSEPVPDYKRCAFDIEVETDGKSLPEFGESPIRCIAVSTPNMQRSLVFSVGEKNEIQTMDDYVARRFASESDMLTEFFGHIDKFPIWATYNGDKFDLPYLCRRAAKLGISSPMYMRNDTAIPERHIHIDLYGVFHNHALQIYAFGHKYKSFGLDDVSRALLGRGKLDVSATTESMDDLERYCANDSQLTLDLTSYDDGLVMKVLTMFSRISGLSIDDVSRTGISNWAKYMIYRHCHLNKMLVPSSRDIPEAEATLQARTRDKKYEGATILETLPGVYFGATVMDFASLYPSIVQRHNISYETVNCGHSECRANIIPGTVHWSCTRHQGVMSLLIGSLKELRVNYYKERREEGMNAVIEQVLKVFLNASYGIIGFSSFPLYYLPTAESVTAVGRTTLQRTVERAKEVGLSVIGGDTDSIFIDGRRNPASSFGARLASLGQWADNEFSLQLQVDKEFRMLALSDRKKNYFGVYDDGSTDIKGLSAKKNNIPPAVRLCAKRVIDILAAATSPEELSGAKIEARAIIKMWADRIGGENLGVEELAFTVMVGKNPSEYKSVPQVVKAGMQLGPVKKGDFVSFVKIKGGAVRPVQLASVDEIDREKYLEILESTMRQIIEPFGMDFGQCMGQTKMSDFWG